MNAEQLSRVGEKLVKRCGSRDPFEIARQLGINVMLCENFGSLKGMYRVIKRNRFIFLNNSLDENMLRIVCAHELGHDQLHRNMAKTTPIHEFMLYDMKSKPEYEANIVAAEILMDSNEVLRYIYEYGYTAEQIASAMSTDINKRPIFIEFFPCSSSAAASSSSQWKHRKLVSHSGSSSRCRHKCPHGMRRWCCRFSGRRSGLRALLHSSG